MATLEIGDELQIGPAAKLIYAGNNTADICRFIPERSRTGGLTNSGKGEWKVNELETGKPLTEQQIAYWMAKKGN